VAEVKIEFVSDANGGRVELFAEDDGGAWVGFPLDATQRFMLRQQIQDAETALRRSRVMRKLT
jgi:hypothetical protein